MSSTCALPDAYVDFAQGVFARIRQYSSLITRADDVVQTAWRMVNDAASPRRLAAGADALALAEALGPATIGQYRHRGPRGPNSDALLVRSTNSASIRVRRPSQSMPRVCT